MLNSPTYLKDVPKISKNLRFKFTIEVEENGKPVYVKKIITDMNKNNQNFPASSNQLGKITVLKMPHVFPGGSKKLRRKVIKNTYQIKKDKNTGYISIIRNGLTNIPIMNVSNILKYIPL